MDPPTPFGKVGKTGSYHKRNNYLYSDFLYSICLRDLILCLQLGLGRQTWQVVTLTILGTYVTLSQVDNWFLQTILEL